MTSIQKTVSAVEWFETDVSHRFRHRTLFASCRGTVARSKASAVLNVRAERESLRMACTALRTMREALAMHEREIKRGQDAREYLAGVAAIRNRLSGRLSGW